MLKGFMTKMWVEVLDAWFAIGPKRIQEYLRADVKEALLMTIEASILRMVAHATECGSFGFGNNYIEIKGSFELVVRELPNIIDLMTQKEQKSLTELLLDFVTHKRSFLSGDVSDSLRYMKKYLKHGDRTYLNRLKVNEAKIAPIKYEQI